MDAKEMGIIPRQERSQFCFPPSIAENPPSSKNKNTEEYFKTALASDDDSIGNLLCKLLSNLKVLVGIAGRDSHDCREKCRRGSTQM